MNARPAQDDRLPRYLGLAFVAVFASSLASGLLSGPILTGSISETLVNISGNLAPIRASILLQLLTSAGIVVLASLLYANLRDQGRVVASIALGLWLVEAVVLAVGMLGVYALLPLAQEFVRAGAPAPSSYRALGSALVGVEQNAYSIHMLFFCLGAVPWYCLLLRSRLVPRVVAGWGLLAVFPMLAGMLLILWDRGLDPGILPFVPYVPFELVIGVWLLARGAGSGEAVRPSTSRSTVRHAVAPAADQ